MEKNNRSASNWTFSPSAFGSTLGNSFSGISNAVRRAASTRQFIPASQSGANANMIEENPPQVGHSISTSSMTPKFVPTAHVTPHKVSTGVSTVSGGAVAAAGPSGMSPEAVETTRRAATRLYGARPLMYRPKSSPMLSPSRRPPAAPVPPQSPPNKNAGEEYVRQQQQQETIEYLLQKVHNLETQFSRSQSMNQLVAAAEPQQEITATVDSLRQMLNEVIEAKNTQITGLESQLKSSDHKLEICKEYYRQELEKLKLNMVRRDDECDELRSKLKIFDSTGRSNPQLAASASMDSLATSASASRETLLLSEGLPPSTASRSNHSMYAVKYNALKRKYQALKKELEQEQNGAEALRTAIDLQNDELKHLRSRVAELERQGGSGSKQHHPQVSRKTSDQLGQCRAALAGAQVTLKCVLDVCRDVVAGGTPNVNRVLGIRSSSMSDLSELDTNGKQPQYHPPVDRQIDIINAKAQALKRDIDTLQTLIQQNYTEKLCEQVDCKVQ